MKPSGILGKRATPGNWQGKEQRVEPGIIEAFTEITTGGDQHPLFVFRNTLQRLRRRARLLCAHAAVQYHDISREFRKAFGQHGDMILALGDHDRGPASFEGGEDIIEDQIIPYRILYQLRI